MAAEPEIIAAAQKFKRALLRDNDAAMRELGGAYAEAWRRLKAQLDAVTALINEAEAMGKVPTLRPVGTSIPLSPEEYTINWLARQARYRELMYQIELEMLQLSKQGAAMVGRQQAAALDAGREHATALLQKSLGPAPAESGVVWLWNRVPDSAMRSLVGFLADGSPLDYKFAGLAVDTVAGIKRTFAAGLAQGWNPRKIARTIQREFNGALANALTTCRTETMRAYRTASHETYRANDDVVKGWIWSCAHQARTCAACWGMDGTFHKLTERLVDHPNGRCVATPVTTTWAEILGKPTTAKETGVSRKGWNPEDKFKELPEEDQRRILGKRRYELWAEGKIGLRDLPVKERSKVWGDHYRPKTVREIEAELTRE